MFSWSANQKERGKILESGGGTCVQPEDDWLGFCRVWRENCELLVGLDAQLVTAVACHLHFISLSAIVFTP